MESTEYENTKTIIEKFSVKKNLPGRMSVEWRKIVGEKEVKSSRY